MESIGDDFELNVSFSPLEAAQTNQKQKQTPERSKRLKKTSSREKAFARASPPPQKNAAVSERREMIPTERRRKTSSLLEKNTRSIHKNNENSGDGETSKKAGHSGDAKMRVAKDTSTHFSEPSKKFVEFSAEEDPMQYHARPRDLSQGAGEVRKTARSEYIFTRQSFSSLKIPQKVADLLEKEVEKGGFSLKTATRVQSAVIPALLEQKHNVLVKSETGSGKTLAYLLPILTDLLSLDPPVSRTQGTYAIILAPTRELCSQISDVVDRLTKCCVSIVGGCITGGARRKSEKARLRKGVNILVASPGRMLDHLKATESFNLNNLRWMVLDEADRLLDMGFENAILEICSILKGSSNSEQATGVKPPEVVSSVEKPLKILNMSQKKREQSLTQSKLCKSLKSLSYMMVSATLTTALKRISYPIMGSQGFTVVDAEKESTETVETIEDLNNLGKDKGRLDGYSSLQSVQDDGAAVIEDKRVRSSDLSQGEMVSTPAQLCQYYMQVTCKWRLAALLCFLKQHSHEKIMVFFATCDSVDYHSLLLNKAEWPQELDAPLDNHAGKGEAGPDGREISSGRHDGSSEHLDPLPSVFSSMILERSMLSEEEIKGEEGQSCVDNMYRLHGNVPQNVRQEVYKKFCKAKRGILFCTDVAARGLDLPKIDWIIQYDAPCETTDYVHRIGRTARRGEGGNSLLFVLPSESQYLTLLSSHGVKPEPLSLQQLFLQAGEKYIPGSQKFKNKDEMTAVILQRRIETAVLSNKILLQASRQAFRSFIRAYATHSADTKGIFRVQSLHLGHVAKSFGLRESPSALRSHDDVIGKVFNGFFTKEYLKEHKMTKQSRNEKYSLSTKSAAGKKRSRANGEQHNDRSNKKSKSNNNLTQTSGSKGVKKGKQKIRQMGNLTSSGSFRKANGYFNKKLRVSSSTEFSS